MSPGPALATPGGGLSPALGRAPRVKLPDRRRALGGAALAALLLLQGYALAQSYLWAAPILAALFVAVAVDVPLPALLAVALTARVLTDDLASATARHSVALSPSSLIAVLFILLALGLVLRRRVGLGPAIGVSLAIGLWTTVAALGAESATLAAREGVRELSILAVAVIVLNSRGSLSASLITRVIQLAGSVAALLAIYQLLTHGGELVGSAMRANGTFAHPNDAAVYFAIATLASIWRFTELGHRRLDAAFALLFAGSALATFSIDGFLTMLVMIAAFAALRPGSRRRKLRLGAVALALALLFLATPLGAARLASETAPRAGSEGSRASRNSLEWRLYKWETLLPEWEQAPYLGKGLGTTLTAEATSQNTTVGNLPHSEYVRYLVETGAIGLLAALLAVAALWRRLWRGRRRAGGLAALGLALLSGLLVNALAANTLLYTPAAYAAALIVGAVLAGLRTAARPPAGATA